MLEARRMGPPEIGVGTIAAVDPAAGVLALVLVLAAPKSDRRYVRCCLLSNEVEMRTEHDVLVSRDESSLPFEVIAQCDLLGWIEAWRLTPWSRVEAGTVAVVLDWRSAWRDSRWGPPYGDGSLDPRWPWKLAQLAIMQRISAPAHATLIGLSRPLETGSVSGAHLRTVGRHPKRPPPRLPAPGKDA